MNSLLAPILSIRTWLTQKQKDLLGIKLSSFPPMALNHFNIQIRKFQTNYPCSSSSFGSICPTWLCSTDIFLTVYQTMSCIKLVVPKHWTPRHVSLVKPKRATLQPTPRLHRSLPFLEMFPHYILADPSSPCIKWNLQALLPLTILLYQEEMLCPEEKPREQMRQWHILQMVTQNFIIRKPFPR